MTVFSDAIFFTDIIEYYQISCLIVILFLTTSIVLALKRRREGGLFILIGILVLFATVVNDIMLAHHANTIPISQFGLNFFLFAQSVLLAMKFSNAFNQVEIDEVRIRKMNKELIEKERARTLFFHNTSHELRTPLNGIIGYLEILKLNRYGKLPTRIRGQLNKITTLAESLKLQVNTILDLAKEKKGELKVTNSMVSMKSLIEYASTISEGLSKKEGVSFDIDSNWKGGAEGTLVCDREKVDVIIRNLLGNAFKFKDPDRDNNVSFNISFEDKNLKMIVTDTGLGIPDEFREKMYKEFEQAAKDASRAHEGTGLGLALVKKLVDAMKGTITYDSKVGEGTTFTVNIPSQTNVDATSETKVEKVEEVSEKIEEKVEPNEVVQTKDSKNDQIESEGDYEAEEMSKEEIPMNAEKDYYILVVDDNEVNLEVISEVLMIHEYTVEIADGGQKALDMLYKRERKPDLIILDLMMPEVSGEDVLKKVKSNDVLRDIPVMLLTARASQDDKLFGLGIGADDYLAKPIENRELLLRVKNLLIRVDLSRLMESYIHREKMAQMGELMGDMSHELKNIHQANSSDSKIEEKRVDRLLKRLPVKSDKWDDTIQSMFKSYVEFSIMRERGEDFITPSTGNDDEKRTYANISRILKKLDIDDETLKVIWNEMILLNPDFRADAENIMVLNDSLKIKTNAGKKAYELLMSILDYSREDDSKQCRMSDVINDTSLLLGMKIRKGGITFETELDDTFVKANASDMHQIAVNLVTNSCHALSGVEGNSKVIKISQRDEKDSVVYSFEDNGGGIDPGYIDKIFDRSFTTKGAEGSGIGLFVSKRLAGKNNGGLSVTSEEGKTVFELRLAKDGAAS
jgi:signal transduction histidine kinase